MSEETEHLNDLGSDQEAQDHLASFMDDLKSKKAPKAKEDRPAVPEPQEKPDKASIDEFLLPDASEQCRRISKVMLEAETLAANDGNYTVMGVLAMLTRVKKEAESMIKDMEEKAGEEFEFRMATSNEKTISVGMGNFRRNGVKNVWEYTDEVVKLEEKSKEAAEAVKKQQKIEQANGKARCTTLPPAKPFAVSV